MTLRGTIDRIRAMGIDGPKDPLKEIRDMNSDDQTTHEPKHHLHGDPEVKTHKCGICKRTFSSYRAATQHHGAWHGGQPRITKKDVTA